MIQAMLQSQSSSPLVIQDRVETLNSVLLGDMTPIERRQKLLRKRLGIDGEGPTEDNSEDEQEQEQEELSEEERHKQRAPNTSERSSWTGTTSASDIHDQDFRTGADRPDGKEPVSTGSSGSNTKSAKTPSMSEAARQKMESKPVTDGGKLEDNSFRKSVDGLPGVKKIRDDK